MLLRYTFWLAAAILFEFLTAIIHGASLFLSPESENETEQQLHQLFTTYHRDLGAGFHPTLSNLFTALSACFPLMCLLSGLTLGYLLIRHTEPALMKGVIGINMAIFGVVFLLMAYFTFLAPIIFTGLIFFNLLLAYIVVPDIESAI